MAVFLGVLAAFFFSITFVLNQVMASSGGFWLWTATLRFLIMIPLFIILIRLNKKSSLFNVIQALKRNPISWMIWSQVAFAIFYLPLCFASTQAPGWLVASTWQITIIAGSILAPFIEIDPKKKSASYLSVKEICCFAVIILGIIIIEAQHFSISPEQNIPLAFISILLAAFAYPLGNRKIMQLNHTNNPLDTDERILAMLIASLPTWLGGSLIAYIITGVPTTNQVFSSFIVALFSGFIATFLFFKATQLTQHHLKKLATVEATQSLEVVFSVLLGLIFLKDSFPNLLTFIGLSLIIIGMVLKVLKY